jgi:tetratricopeptide (TPR) repeat protein
MEGPKEWGRLARKGAGTMRPRPDGQTRGMAKDFRQDSGPPDRDIDEWVRVDGGVRDEAERAVGRSRPKDRAAAPELDTDSAEGELQGALGPARAARAQKRQRDAARSFARGYDDEARRILKPLAKEAPGASAVRELYGLALYRLGRYEDAAIELEAFRQLTGATEQHPVLADSYRALKRHDEVVRLWDELRGASPSAELVTEGRIVMAGSLADRGRLDDAIRVLSDKWRMPKRPQEHHLRRAYALADLYERAGDLPRARELFRRVHAADPRFGDVAKRVRSLG